jgi:hypothetical protein
LVGYAGFFCERCDTGYYYQHHEQNSISNKEQGGCELCKSVLWRVLLIVFVTGVIMAGMAISGAHQLEKFRERLVHAVTVASIVGFYMLVILIVVSWIPLRWPNIVLQAALVLKAVITLNVFELVPLGCGTSTNIIRFKITFCSYSNCYF